MNFKSILCGMIVFIFALVCTLFHYVPFGQETRVGSVYPTLFCSLLRCLTRQSFGNVQNNHFIFYAFLIPNYVKPTIIFIHKLDMGIDVIGNETIVFNLFVRFSSLVFSPRMCGSYLMNTPITGKC